MNNLSPNYSEFVSHWEISEYLNGIDLLVVGAGIVGLTTAIFHKKKHPNAKITVVERGFLPSGASTKNAGFACFGSLSELLSDLESNSTEDVFRLVGERLQGLNELRALLGDKQLDYQPCGGYELFGKNDPELFDKCNAFMPEANRIMSDLHSLKATYSVEYQLIGTFGFKSTDHLILNKYEGSIDTGKMMRGLIELAQKLEIDILTGVNVNDWSQDNESVLVRLHDKLDIRVKNLHIATNGFANQLLPEEDILPARAQVLITEPIENLLVKGTFHLDAGFYYFRNVGNRLLLGGGRNLDIDGETDTELTVTDRVQSSLNQLLREVILPETDFTIAHRWAGVMGVGKTKHPIVKRLSDNVTCSVRLGGMGVALGTSVGRKSSELIS